MAYTDEVRALYDQAEADLKASTTEQGNVARGQATRRAASSGRLNQPVQEWTYSELEKNLAAALNTGLADLARQEAGALGSAQQLQEQKNEFEANQARLNSESERASRSHNLESIFGLLGTVAPYVMPGGGAINSLAPAGRVPNTSIARPSGSLTPSSDLYRQLSGGVNYSGGMNSRNPLLDIYSVRR